MNSNNTIFIANIRIDEPVVALTDLLVAFLCFYFSFQLHPSGKNEKVIYIFKIYFLTMGLATFLGGIIGHAFLYAFNFYWKLPGWIISMISIMFIERAVIQHTRIWLKKSIVRFLKIINIIEFLTFLTLTIFSLNFFYVEFHSGYGLMFVVLSLETFLFIKTRNTASKYLLTAVGFAAIAALFFMNKISPHQWFNYIAASHIFMAIAATFFYIGAKKIDMSVVDHSSSEKKI
jgi:hypothetical protein